MAADNSYQREQHKEALRKNMMDGNDSPIAVSPLFGTYKKKIGGILLCILLFAGTISMGYYIFSRLRTYSSYKVTWSMEANSLSSQKLVSFGKGLAIVGKDGVQYCSSEGEIAWSVPYDMKTPTASVNGSWLLVYDLDGRSMVICNTEGRTGTVSAAYPVSKAAVSSAGVVAAVLEETKSSCVCYYKNTGDQLDIRVPSSLLGKGYPMAMDISPNGQELAVAYYEIGEGTWSSRVVFYDFEKGPSDGDRIVGNFSAKDTDTLAAAVFFLSDSAAFAVGDNEIFFYSLENRTALTMTEAPIEGKIEKVFYSSDFIGIAAETDDGFELQIYSASGEEKARITESVLYDEYQFNGDDIVMTNETECRILTLKGKERFCLTFANGIHQILPADGKESFYLSTGSRLQKIRLTG